VTDLLIIFPWAVALGLASLLATLFYFLYYKPKTEIPMPNERYEGIVTVFLPRLGLMKGPMTHARQTVEYRWGQLMSSETDEVRRTLYEESRKQMMKNHLFAHSTDNGKKLYLFDSNPMGQQFIVAEEKKGKSKTSLIHHVQDAESVGELNGFEVISVKLDPTEKTYTAADLKLIDPLSRCLKYLQAAASNVGEVAELKAINAILGDNNETLRKELRKATSDREAFAEVASKKLLIRPPEEKVPGKVQRAIKQWFSWPQVVVGMVAYLGVPHVFEQLGWHFSEPTFSMILIALTLAAFFSISVLRRLFGRFL